MFAIIASIVALAFMVLKRWYPEFYNALFFGQITFTGLAIVFIVLGENNGE